jgi:hypothetical protein
MALTIGNWILIIGIALTGIVFAIAAFYEESTYVGIGLLIITIGICVALMFYCNWYNTNTAQGARNLKDQKSNLGGGLEREIIITAEDGREIFHYEGKVDIETNHDGNANYILFESEEGKRYIIYYGIMDTVLIIEK